MTMEKPWRMKEAPALAGLPAKEDERPKLRCNLSRGDLAISRGFALTPLILGGENLVDELRW
jgi:hypothetical protein